MPIFPPLSSWRVENSASVLSPLGRCLLSLAYEKEGQEGHAIVVLRATAGLCHARQPCIDVVRSYLSDLTRERSSRPFELGIQVDYVSFRFLSPDRGHEFFSQLWEANRRQCTSALFFFQVPCIKLRGVKDGLTRKDFVRFCKLSGSFCESNTSRSQSIRRVINGGGLLGGEGSDMGNAGRQLFDDLLGPSFCGL